MEYWFPVGLSTARLFPVFLTSLQGFGLNAVLFMEYWTSHVGLALLRGLFPVFLDDLTGVYGSECCACGPLF